VLVAVTATPFIVVVSGVSIRRENRPGAVTWGLLMPGEAKPCGLMECVLPLPVEVSRRALSASASACVAARRRASGLFGSTMAY
jgi:hypothetical protein